MRSKRAILFLIFPLFISIPSASGQPSGMKPGLGMGMRQWMGGQCWKASDLNLSAEQVKGLELIQQSYLKDTQLLRAELFLRRLELKESLVDPVAKADVIRSKSSEINELQSRLDERSVEYLIRVRNLLTKEQLKNWCPELDIPFPRRMMHGPGPMGPISPQRTPSREKQRED